MAEGDTNLTNLVLSGDLSVGDDTTFTDDVAVTGDLDVDGTANLDAVDIDGAVQIDAAVTVGVDGTSFDVKFFSDTAGDYMLWDESAEALIIIGTDAQNALDIQDGNLNVADDAVIGDTLDVNGDIDLDGDGFDVDITAGFSIDADAASNINVAGAGIDLTLESEAGSIVVKGDEAVATAVTIDADDAAGTGVTIATGATGGLNVSGGMTTISNGITGVVNVENIMLPTVLSVPITYTAAAGGTGAVATIGDGEIWIIHSVFARVTTNFDCTGDDATLVVGDGNDADGFLVLADTELQAADTEGTGFAAGWQGMTAATIGDYLENAGGGFIYAPSGAPETIDWLVDEVSGETLTAGAATIYVVYTRIA